MTPLTAITRQLRDRWLTLDARLYADQDQHDPEFERRQYWRMAAMGSAVALLEAELRRSDLLDRVRE